MHRPRLAICAGLAHGREYSDCRGSEEMSQKCFAHELSKILESKGRIFTPQTDMNI